MILRGDVYPARCEVLTGMVAAMVSELQLERPPAERVAEHLVAQADAEDRPLTDEFAHGAMHVIQRGRITRPGGKKDAVRVERQHLRRAGARRDHPHLEPVLPQPAQDVALQTVIVGDDVVAHRRQLGHLRIGVTGGARHVPPAAVRVVRVPVVLIGRGDHPHIIPAHPPLPRPRAVAGFLRREILRRETGFHRALFTKVPGQRPRVDALQTDDAVLGEIFRQTGLRAPTARKLAEFLDDESLDLRAGALAVRLVDAVVADERIRHRHDLPVVRRIGEHLLVTGH